MQRVAPLPTRGQPWGSRLGRRVDEPITEPAHRIVGWERLDTALTPVLTHPQVRAVRVAAPTGAGKTVALGAWMRARSAAGDAVAWVTCDGDPAALHEALDRALALLTVAGGTDAGARTPGPPGGWLVLDNVEQVEDEAGLARLAALCTAPPAGVRVVLSGTTIADAVTARSRLATSLVALDPDVFTLTRDDVAAICAEHGLAAQPTLAADLLDWTEGWAAGVRLTVLDLAGQAAPARRLAGLRAHGGGDLLAHAALRTPLLADGRTRRLLAHLAVLPGAFSARTAVAVSGEPYAAAVLEEAVAGQAFVVATPDGRYRLRHWLRSALLPLAPESAHGRAAGDALDRGDGLAALRHALAAADPDLLDEVLTEVGAALICDRDAAAVATLLEGPLATACPSPAVVLAAVHAGVTDLPDSLGRARAAFDALDPATLTPAQRRLRAALAIELARRDGTVASAILDVDADLRAPSGHPAIDAFALAVSGTAAKWQAESGTGGVTALTDALERATAHDWARLRMRCHADLALFAALRRDHRAQQAHGSVVLNLADSHRWQRSGDAFRMHAALGHAALEGLRLDEAAEHVASLAAIDPSTLLPSYPGGHALAPFYALWLDAMVAREQGGDRRAAQRQCARAAQRLNGVRLYPPVIASTSLIECELHLELGDYPAAQRLLDAVKVPLGGAAEPAVLKAWLQLARGSTQAAWVTLQPVLDGSLPVTLPPTEVRAALIHAELAEVRGNVEDAVEALARALLIAEELDVPRALLHSGPAIARLLARHQGRFGRAEGLADRVRSRLPAAGQGVLATGLTARERAVLRALAGPRTLTEIAEGERVSVNTVKTHVRNVYRKLGVRSRRDAVAAARAAQVL